MSKVILSHIAAVSENNVIGFQGDLPWDIPEDLKYFFNKTKHKILIMGRKSFDSLGKALPHRMNIILTRQKDFSDKYKLQKETVFQSQLNKAHLNLELDKKKSSPTQGSLENSFENIRVFSNIEEAVKYASKPIYLEKYGNEIFIAGGAEIYKQTLLSMDRLYITKIHKSYKGDAFYPDIPKDKFKLLSQSDRKEPVPFSFLVYEKVK